MIGQGRENAKTFLKENPSYAYELDVTIREHYGLPLPPPFNASEDSPKSADPIE